MPKRSLLLPDHLGKPPKAVAEPNAAYADALETRKATALAVRDARAKRTAAKRKDEAPSVVRECEREAEDAEHAHRVAKRTEAAALGNLANAIATNAPALLDRVNITERAERALSKLDDFAAELDQLTEEVGTVKTILTVSEDRTQSRGFEPFRQSADRHSSSQAHQAGLREHVEGLRQIAARLTQPPSAPTADEQDFQRRAQAMRQLARGAAVVH